MNVIEHLLVCLVEECAELQHHVSKSIRFGLDDHNPRADSPTNCEEIVNELNDLFAIVELLQKQGALPSVVIDPDKIRKKQEKVRLFMQYAKSQGTLKADSPVDL